MKLKGYSLQTLNLDSFTDEELWPSGDFIGLSDFRVMVEDYYKVYCQFVISTEDDLNLHRMGDLIAELSDLLMPMDILPVYDTDSGLPVGQLYVLNGVRINEPIPLKTRAAQPIMVAFNSNLLSS